MTNSQKWLWFLIIVVLGILLYLLLPIMTPFAAGAIIAYIGDPIVNRLHHWKIPRTLGVVIFFLIIILIISLLLFIFIPILEKQIATLINKLPAIIDWLQNTFFPWALHFFGGAKSLDLSDVKIELIKSLEQTKGLVSQIISTVTQSGFALIALAFNLVLIPVVAFYLLRDWRTVVDNTRSILPRAVEPLVVRLVHECNEVLGAFLRGQLLVMFCLGCIYSIGLWIVGVEFALLIGIMAGLASIVPYLGFFVGISAALIAAYLQFKTILSLVYVVIVFAIGEAAESAVLVPLLVGDRIGLHPVAVIFAVLAGGELFGFVGVLLALPVAAVVMVLLRHAKERYVHSQLYAENRINDLS